jgi:integrase
MTAAKCYRLLRAMLASAVEQELLPATPCTLKGAGDEWSPERPVISVEQVLVLAEEVGQRWRAVVLLAVFCGLRFGELSALRRADLDLRAGTVTVRATAGEALGTGRVVGPPKSAAGRRVLSIPGAIVPDLRLHLTRFAAPGEQGLVFVGPRGGPLQSANFGSAVWRPARERAGLPHLHFHDLRHTGNTLAAATGASLAELMARMGHASTEAALRYQHATQARDAAVAQALSDLVGVVATLQAVRVQAES